MLNEIKEYLRISGDAENVILESAIARGKGKLNDIAGIELDFVMEGLAKALLFDYVRYSFNNASEYFEENFQREILRLQLQAGVTVMKNENQSRSNEGP